MSNLLFMDRFNGDLSGWTLDQSGGAVTIVMKDSSPKMKLDDTSGAGVVSATKTISEPVGKWIFEYDIIHDAASVGIAELLDASNNILVTVDLGSTANTLSFSTNTAGASTAAFNSGVYKQVVLAINSVTLTVKAYISEDDVIYGSLAQVGATKSYTGTVAKLRFKTGVTQTGAVHIDEVKAYTPDLFIIGDSFIDGKFFWSTHPGYNDTTYNGGRLIAKEDETSPPQYRLGLLMGADTWVGARAFGGSKVADVDSKIQSVILDHGAQRVFVSVGTNDMGVTALSAMQASFNSIISKIQAAGITGTNIIIGNCIPWSGSGSTADDKRYEWNRWLKNKAASIGTVYVDLHNTMKDPLSPLFVKSSYIDTDSIDNHHLNPTGSVVLATTIYNAMNGVKDKVIQLAYSQSGITAYATMKREADGYLLDDSSGAFAAKPADPYVYLAEDYILKGFYELRENRVAWNDGRYVVTIYKQAGASPAPASDTIVGTGEMDIISDTEIYPDVLPSSRLDAASYTAPDNAGVTNLLVIVTLLNKYVRNKKEIKTEAGVKSLIIYDDNGTTELVRKALKDPTGTDISNLVAGVMALENASSV